jgi:hypothetical protein
MPDLRGDAVTAGPARSKRNNNPGNLDAGQPWRGLMPKDALSPEQKAETRFAVFSSPSYGFRAMALVLLNYDRLHGIHTIDGIIHRWAPPSENDTEAYINAVCRGTGRLPNESLNLRDHILLESLCKQIAIHEAGGWVWDDTDLHQGVALAVSA